MQDATLLRRAHPLAAASVQRQRLAEASTAHDFASTLDRAGQWPLRARSLDTLQINVGRRCNQVCAHCHVDAGPGRPEVMGDAVVEACLHLLEEGPFHTLDITGGAPELHPRFREIIRRAASLDRAVLHRCNLTAMRLPAYADIPAFLAEHRVGVIASLPCYDAVNVDRQRGDGVFVESIQALRELNALGYGRDASLRLDLVLNPLGARLPGDGVALEAAYKRALRDEHDIVFDRLLTMTNMPISRFLEHLEESGELEGYMELLADAFNPDTVPQLMCRSMLSVDHAGGVYDCDFHQMLEIGAEPAMDVLDLSVEELVERACRRSIRVAPHCFGCTAGHGSSCGGTLTDGDRR